MRLSILPFEKNMTWQDFDGGFKYIIENILKRYILEKWHVKLWGLKILGGNVIRSNKSKRLHIYIYIYILDYRKGNFMQCYYHTLYLWIN